MTFDQPPKALLEAQKESLLIELRNSPLAERLKEASEQEGGLPAEYQVFAPYLVQLKQETDGLGCALACYRSMLRAQQKDDPGQESIRKRANELGLIPGGAHNMASFDARTAAQLGIYQPMGFDWRQQNIEDKRELEGKQWTSVLARAIEKGNLVLASLPMKHIYKNASASIEHAVVIYGVRYNNGKLTFLIHDPLDITTELPDEGLINWSVELGIPPTVIIAPPISESSKGKMGGEIKVKRPRIRIIGSRNAKWDLVVQNVEKEDETIIYRGWQKIKVLASKLAGQKDQSIEELKKPRIKVLPTEGDKPQTKSRIKVLDQSNDTNLRIKVLSKDE